MPAPTFSTPSSPLGPGASTSRAAGAPANVVRQLGTTFAFRSSHCTAEHGCGTHQLQATPPTGGMAHAGLIHAIHAPTVRPHTLAAPTEVKECRPKAHL